MEMLKYKTNVNPNLPYVEILNKLGMSEKLVNFANDEVCPKKGLVELRVNHKNRSKDTSISFKTFVDRTTDIRYGIPNGTDKNGDIIWKRIILNDVTIYDLSNPSDQKEWACVRMFYMVKGSPLYRDGKTYFEVFDYEIEAKKKRKKLNTIARAAQLANDMKGHDIYDFARIIGIPVGVNSRNIIEGLVAEHATNFPEDFVDKWDNANRRITSVFKRALETRVINHDPLKGYFYNAIYLGDSEPLVIDWLSKNTSTTMIIDTQAKKLDKAYNQVENGGVVEPEPINGGEINKTHYAELANQNSKQQQTIDMLMREINELKALNIPNIPQNSSPDELAHNLVAEPENIPQVMMNDFDDIVQDKKKKK